MGTSRKLLLLLTAIFAVGLSVVMWGDAAVLAVQRALAATPSEAGELTIVAQDYEFVPNVVRVKAGQEIKLTIRNNGLHTHEFMAGKAVHVEHGVIEPPAPDFFAELPVEVTGSGMPMGFAGMEGMDMGGMDMDGEHAADEHAAGDEHASDSVDMSGMDMGGEPAADEHADGDEHAGDSMDMGGNQAEEEMAMGDEHAADEHTADEDMAMGKASTADEQSGAEPDEHAAQTEAQHPEAEPDETPMAAMGEGESGMAGMGDGARVVIPGAHTEAMEMGHDDHHGGMVMVDPGHESTLTFTIPADKAGVWTFGCFQEEGLHFEDGMQGLLIVEK
jgi:plastocyanin